MAVSDTSLVMLWVLATLASKTVFPLPEIKCPVAEEGKESHSIECTFQATDEARFKGLWFESGGKDVIYCNRTTCGQSELYEASIYDMQMARSNFYVSSLLIKKVKINDDRTWRCKVELENISTKLADQCILRVYSPPEQPTCSHKLTTSSVEVDCATRRVYPKAACKWFVNGSAIDQTHMRYIKSDNTHVGEYYRTDCRMTYQPHHSGKYNFDVLMFPEITEPGFFLERAATTESLIVDIGRQEHCDSSTTNRTFGVAVNTDITVKICVLAYPEPKNYTLYRGKSPVSSQTYRANFHYTNQAKAEGEVILTIYAFKQQDLGAYTLKSDNKEFPDPRLQFHLIEEGPADCPTEFVVENVATHSLTLSWRPGFDGGRPQTFVLLRFLGHNDHVILEKVNHSNEARLSYNITGLSASTFYEFGVYVENDVNTTKCPEIQANGTTQGFPRADSSLTNIVVAVVVIQCLIVLVIAVIFVLRRQRRSRKNYVVTHTASVKQSRNDNIELNQVQRTDHEDSAGYTTIDPDPGYISPVSREEFYRNSFNLDPASPQTDYGGYLLLSEICEGYRNATTLDPSDRNMHTQTTSEQTAMICGNTPLMEQIEEEEVQYWTID